MSNEELTALADRLEAHNRWMREKDDPYTIDPAQIRSDLYAAIRIIRLAALPPHVYQGGCPDESQPDARDPDGCPACRAMMAIEAAR